MLACKNGSVILFTEKDSKRRKNLSLSLNNYDVLCASVFLADIVIILEGKKWKFIKNKYSSDLRISKDMILLTRICFDNSLDFEKVWKKDKKSKDNRKSSSKLKNQLLEETVEIEF